MPIRSESGFPIPVLVVTFGMLLPTIPIAFVGEIRYDPIAEQFVSVPDGWNNRQHHFLLGLGLLFALELWILIERFDLDRLDYLLVSIVWPWVIVLGSVFGVFLVTGAPVPWDHPVGHVFNILTGAGAVQYAAAFMGGGVAAYGLTRLGERFQPELAPDSRKLTLTLDAGTGFRREQNLTATLCKTHALSLARTVRRKSTFPRFVQLL